MKALLRAGHSDLSQSMGHPGNPKAPPVAKAIADTVQPAPAAISTPISPGDRVQPRLNYARTRTDAGS